MKKAFLFSLFFFLFIFSPTPSLAVVGSDVDVIGDVTGPPLPPPTYISPFSISNILVKEVSMDSAIVLWNTNEAATCKLFWGKSIDYEEGSILGGVARSEHFTTIPDLSADTTYYFKVSCRNKTGQEIESVDQKFTTLAVEVVVPPSEVSFFESVSGDSKVELKWGNPENLSFRGVRLVRSITKYPQTPFDEKLIYEGPGSSFTDTGLINGAIYYYSIFTYDKYGSYSSGSFVFGTPKIKREKPEEITGKAEPPKIPPEITKGIALELTDFIFSQDGKIQPFVGQIINLKSGRPFTVSIVGERISSEAKNMVITFFQPDPLSVVFQYNTEKKEFIALNPSIDIPGQYYFVVQIINENGEVFAFTMGQVKAEEIPQPAPEMPKTWYQQIWLCIVRIYQTIIIWISSLTKAVETMIIKIKI